jgi:hypothetical protein
MANPLTTAMKVVSFCTLFGVGISAQAGSLTFNFTGPTGNVGSNKETFTSGLYSVTAYGFNNDTNTSAHNLYDKNSGGGETGIGLVSTLDNELTLKSGGSTYANFIQLDVSQIEKVLASATIEIGSVTGPEKYDLYGSNTLGSIGTLLASGLSSSSAVIPQWGKDAYISVAVHADPCNPCDNVLVGGLCGTIPTTVVTTAAVPEPSSILMLSTAVVVGMGVVFFRQQ